MLTKIRRMHFRDSLPLRDEPVLNFVSPGHWQDTAARPGDTMMPPEHDVPEALLDNLMANYKKPEDLNRGVYEVEPIRKVLPIAPSTLMGCPEPAKFIWGRVEHDTARMRSDSQQNQLLARPFAFEHEPQGLTFRTEVRRQ
jgi:hypothetical protein